VRDVAKHYEKRISIAGLSELHAIAAQLEKHYQNGTLSASELGKLDVKVMEEIARFEELYSLYT